MATLKDLFTFPSNSGTGFFNPTYYGAEILATQIESGVKYIIKTPGTTDFTTLGAADNNADTQFTANSTTPTGSGSVYISSSGILGRMNKLIDGDYITHPITWWGASSPTDLSKGISRFINYFNDESTYTSNLSMHSLVFNPCVRFNKSEYNVDLNSRFARINASAQAVWRIQHDAVNNTYVNGDRVNTSIQISNAATGIPTAGTGDYYVKVIDSSVSELYTDSGLTTPYNEGINHVIPSNFPVFIRTQAGAQVLFPLGGDADDSAATDPFAGYNDSTPDILNFRNNGVATDGAVFSTTNGESDAGTLNKNDAAFYGAKGVLENNITNDLKKMDLYTNSGKTTHPTLTEEYYGTLQKTFSATSSSSSLTFDIDVSDSASGYTAGTLSSLANLRTKLNTNKAIATGFGTSFARLSVSGGSTASGTGFDSKNGQQIGTVLGNEYDNLWYVYYDNTTEKVTIAKRMSHGINELYLGWRLLDSSTTLTVHFIDPAELISGADPSVFINFAGVGFSDEHVAENQGGVSTLDKYFIHGYQAITPGAHTYTYKNSSNVTAYGAQFDGKYYEQGGTIQTMTSANTPTIGVVVNGSGYLTSFGPSFGTKNNAVGGIWDNSTSVFLPIESLPNEYITRTPTAIENEDSFNTQDYWVDPAFNINKQWPSNVRPNSAKIVYIQPSTTTISQSGKKYVKSQAFAKYKLELNYPPMTASQFEDFQKVALAVQGQAIPFYVMLKYGDKHILWNDNYSGTTDAVQIEKALGVGNSLVTFGGFSQDEADAFHDGEHVIYGSNQNGNLKSVITENDANIYGEVKVRFSHPSNSALSFGQKCFKNPIHAIVTLAADEFEYTVDVDGFYYVNVSFDLDGWK